MKRSAIYCGIALLIVGCTSAAGPSAIPLTPSPSPSPVAQPSHPVAASLSATPHAPATAATTSPTAVPTSTATATKLPSEGAIDPGTYYVDDPEELGIQRLTFTVPAGWSVADFIAKDSDTAKEVMFTEWPVKYVFQDACKWDETKLADTGTTTQQLVTALAAQKNRTVSGRQTSTTVDGFPAQQVTLTVSPTLDTSTCTHGNLRYWPGAGPSGPDWGSGLCCNAPGNIDTLDVLDVNGKRVVLVARHYPDSSAQSQAELQSVVNSVQIEP